jgi:hypothetical protein
LVTYSLRLTTWISLHGTYLAELGDTDQLQAIRQT